MNKKELISEIALQSSLTKKDVKKVIDCEIEVIRQTLKKEIPIIMVGFGSFKVKKRKSRNAFNPSTHKSMKVPSKKVVTFRAGKSLQLK
jgi:DNA-binding protein HU-beta